MHGFDMECNGLQKLIGTRDAYGRLLVLAGTVRDR